MQYNINNKIKYLIRPMSILFVIFILFVFVIMIGVDKIKTLNQQIISSRKTENSLIQKIAILREVEADVANGVNFADLALPSKNASLFGLSQIKIKARSFGLVIDNIKVGNSSELENDVQKVSISFDALGSDDLIYSFISSFETILPLTKLEKISISSLEGASTANIVLSFYSSKTLTKISAVTGQVNSLTNEELETLKHLSNFDIPFFTETTATEMPIRDDIFN